MRHNHSLLAPSRPELVPPDDDHESYGEPLAHDGMKGYLEPGRWNGSYVFGIDPENGFELKARIEYNFSGDYIMVMEAGHSSLAAPCTLLRRNK